MGTRKPRALKVANPDGNQKMETAAVVAPAFDEMDQSEQITYLKTQLDNIRSYLQNKFQHDVF